MTRIGVILCISLGLLRADPGYAGEVIVSDFYAEPDSWEQANSLVLLLRAHFVTGQRQTVSRSELAQAFQRVVPTRPRSGLTVDPRNAEKLLGAVGADRLLTGSVKRHGNELRITARVYDAKGQILAEISESTRLGSLHEAAGVIATALAPSAKLRASAPMPIPESSLLPFVRAHKALLRRNPTAAAKALRGASTIAAGRVPSAAEIAHAVVNARKLSPELRLEAALVGGDARVTHELARELVARPATAEAAWAARARTHVAQLRLDEAEQDLRNVTNSQHPSVLFARARLAHARNDFALRDQNLDALLAQPLFTPALSWLADLPPGALGGLEARVLRQTQNLTARPELRTALAVRALLGGATASETLPLIQTAYPFGDLGEEIAQRLGLALAAGAPQSARVSAGLALAAGDNEAAKRYLALALNRAEAHPDVALLLARLHTGAEDSAQAVQLLEATTKHGPLYRRSYARALLRVGKESMAHDIFGSLDAPESVETQMALASHAMRAKSPAKAVALLERAAAESPEDAELLTELAAAYRAAGTLSQADLTSGFVRQLRGGVQAPSTSTDEPATAPRPRRPNAMPVEATGTNWLIILAAAAVFGIGVVLTFFTRRKKAPTPSPQAAAPKPAKRKGGPPQDIEIGGAKASTGDGSVLAAVNAGDSSVPGLTLLGDDNMPLSGPRAQTSGATVSSEIPALEGPWGGDTSVDQVPSLELPDDTGVSEYQLGPAHGEGLSRARPKPPTNPFADADPLAGDKTDFGPVATVPDADIAPLPTSNSGQSRNPLADENPLADINPLADVNPLADSPASDLEGSSEIRRAYVGDDDPLEQRLDVNLGGETKPGPPENDSDDDPLGFGNIDVAKTLGNSKDELP